MISEGFVHFLRLMREQVMKYWWKTLRMKVTNCLAVENCLFPSLMDTNFFHLNVYMRFDAL